MTIELPEKARAFVKAQLATGDYADESEVVARALEVWQAWQHDTAEVRAKVEAGIQAADEGRGTMIGTPEEATAFAQTIKQRGRELRAERERHAH